MAAGVRPRPVRKWVERYRTSRWFARPQLPAASSALAKPQAVVERIAAFRRERWTGKQIALETGVSPATVSRTLKRLGLNKLAAIEPVEPVRRYEHEQPGEMIHLNIKKLGRIDGIGHRITGDRRGQSNRRGRARSYSIRISRQHGI